MGLTCHRFCKKGLTCSGRAHQDNALWDPCADSRVFLRVFKEIHDFLQFFFFLLKPGNLCEIDIAGPAHLCTALAKIHHLRIGAASGT